MTGRPDFDVGDLVVCVDDSPCGVFHTTSPARVKGRVYTVANLRHDTDRRTGFTGWGIKVREVATPDWQNCIAYRRIDPKPPAFWTGEVEAEQREGVPA